MEVIKLDMNLAASQNRFQNKRMSNDLCNLHCRIILRIKNQIQQGRAARLMLAAYLDKIKRPDFAGEKVNMQKATSRQLEVFDGGIEGLFGYHRAVRRLALCLLLPLIAGAMLGDQTLVVPLLGTLLICGHLCISGMVNLAVYAAGGDLTAKIERLRQLFRENAKSHLLGLLFFLLAAGAVLAWQKSEGAPIEEIGFRTAVVFGHVFFFCYFPFPYQALVYRRVNLRKLFALAAYVYMAIFLYIFFRVPLDGGVRLAAALLPCLLLPLPFALWLLLPARRDGLFEVAYYSCRLSLAWAGCSYFVILQMPMFVEPELYPPFGPPREDVLTEAWLLGLPLLAYLLAMNWALVFMSVEKIRRGLFVTDLAAFKSGGLGWSLRGGNSKLDRGARRAIAQAAKPLLGSARRWRRVRRVTTWGRLSWVAVLLSSLAAWYILFA